LPGREAAADAALADLITSRIRDIPDYPKPGIVFKDITPLLADGPALQAVVSALASGHGPVDKVVGIEARGFILAASAACQLGSGFVPVRKQACCPDPPTRRATNSSTGPPPSRCTRTRSARGAGPDHRRRAGHRRTAQATASLVRRAGADIVGLAVIMELTFLGGRPSSPGSHCAPSWRSDHGACPARQVRPPGRATAQE
jgi:adenine phosphoribosyltransferase